MTAPPSSPSSARTSGLLGNILLVLGFVAWCTGFIAKTSFVAVDGKRYFTILDDALISLRYAWNFAYGGGLQWNPGGDVEGFTNLLMVLVMAPATLLGSRRLAVLGVRIEGVLLLLALGFLCGRLAQRLLRSSTLSRTAAWRLGFVFGVTCYPLTAFTLEGMETGLVALLSYGALLLTLEDALRPFDARIIGVLLGLAFAARPDGLIVLPLILVFVVAHVGWARGRYLAVHILWPAAAFILAVTLMRLTLYGDVLPNTYYLKVSGLTLAERIKNGLLQTFPYFFIAGPLFAANLLDQLRRPDRQRALCFGYALSLVAYQVWAGGDVFTGLGNYWRFPAPGTPLLMILLVSAADAAFLRWLPAWTAKKRLLICVAPLLLLATLSVNRTSLPEIVLADRLPIGDAESLTNTALHLQSILTEDATIAVTHAGTVPYYTGLKAIDILGKNDRHIAHSEPRLRGDGTYTPGHNKVDIVYSLITLAPDFTEVIGISGDDLAKLVPGHPFERHSFAGESFWLSRQSPNVRWSSVKTSTP